MGRRKKISRRTAKRDADGPSRAKYVEKTREALRAETETRPIEISQRLVLPPVANPQDAADADEEWETVEFDFRPRKIFLANACVACSDRCDPGITCPSCRLVSYCSEDHLARDVEEHRRFCASLTQLRRERENQMGSEVENGAEYRLRRVREVERVELDLQRRLELWEKEVVLYPRACVDCHRTPSDLRRCPDCEIVFWCQETGHGTSHGKWCPRYKIFESVVRSQSRYGMTAPWIPVDAISARPTELDGDFAATMSMLYDLAHDPSGYHARMDVHTYVTLSHIASVPLTALYAFQRSRRDWALAESCTVHVVGAEFHYEGTNLDLWEKLFLHFMPNLKFLRVYMVGPELHLPPDVPTELLTRVRLCPTCRAQDRGLRVTFVPGTLYHDFCETARYRKPDLICLFNPGLYRATGFAGLNTWPKTVDRLCRVGSPILITAYTEYEIPKDVRRIETSCQLRIHVEPRKNPFSSLKPDRNFVSDDVEPLIYKNYFASVVQPLTCEAR